MKSRTAWLICAIVSSVSMLITIPLLLIWTQTQDNDIDSSVIMIRRNSSRTEFGELTKLS